MLKREPKYARHSSGQARVRIDGKVIYLGKYGLSESKERYDDLIAKWHARQADLITQGDTPRTLDLPPFSCSTPSERILTA